MAVAQSEFSAYPEAATPRPVVSNGRTYEFGGPCDGWQVESVKFARAKKRVFLAHEMGLGKTVVALAAIHGENAFPALIIVPNLVKVKWAYEIERWVPGRTVGWIGKIPKLLKGRVSDELEGKDFVICNYEMLSRLKDKATEQFNRLSFKAVVIDESHYCKGYKAARTKLVRDVAKPIPIRLALTGTPVTNRPKEYISQLAILGRLNDLGGWYKFVTRYCAGKRGPWGWEIDGASNLNELVEKMSQTCYSRKRKIEVLPWLPPIRRSTIYVELDERCRDEYDLAERDLATWITETFPPDEAGRKVTAAGSAEAIVKIESLKQIAARGKLGAVEEWLRNFLDETDQKVVIFAHHRSIQNELWKRFPGAARIFADDSPDVRKQGQDKFATDPECRLMVASIKAGGVGINLTAADHVVFVELPWVPSDIDQAEGRAYGRRDNPHPINSWFLLAEDTIDHDISELLDAKAKIVSAATDGAKVNQQSLLASLINRIGDRQ